METYRSHWIECRDDNTLVVHKTEPGPSQWGIIFMVSLWSLGLGGPLLCAPLIAS